MKIATVKCICFASPFYGPSSLPFRPYIPWARLQHSLFRKVGAMTSSTFISPLSVASRHRSGFIGSCAPVVSPLNLSRPSFNNRPRYSCVASTSHNATPHSTDTAVEIPIGKHMTSREIREAFLSFFESKSHTRLPSASLIPDDPTILLNIAGMVPFKPIFLGTAPVPDNPRATTSQKCVRTNDIENVGVTKRHHTFFEMLGNFSFGDYFKKDAIEWAWQLLTRVYEIPPQRLIVSVFETDEEAFSIWRDVVGIPGHRIIRMGADDNFWVSGPTGPCGPCSEIYFDFDPTSEAPIDLEDDTRYIELYNLVFMQYSRNASGDLDPLASKNIDTGMGLERMAQVLQRVPTNYDTDLILPIIKVVTELAGIDLHTATSREVVSLRVVADHLRAVAHLISDGVKPSNVGRGYIVRRLIRRVVRHGRLLGIEGAFTSEVLPKIAQLASEGGLDNIQERLADVSAEMEREESRFLQTLITGEDKLTEVLEKVKISKATVISGADAFELYDTFGFPLELTEEVATENGVGVDKIEFDTCMQRQRERARAAREITGFDVGTTSALSDVVLNAGQTEFVGYVKTSLEFSKITGIVVNGVDGLSDAAFEGDAVRVLLDESPFYAEGGGQVGDTGLITGPDGVLRVDDTQNEAGVYVHIGQVIKGQISIGDEVHAAVNATARRRIMAHHTATHLLQAALKQVIPDGGISQAGSLVDADRLRFDFNCPRAVTQTELGEVEDLINGWISDGYKTMVSNMTLDEAKKAGAVAMFGEKYDANEVRVVDVPGVSMELCGGTHVENTADIGLFKITSESGPSSGVRRIEAVCGAAVMPYLNVRDSAVRELSVSLKARPEELSKRVAALQEDLKAKSKMLDIALAQLAVAKALTLSKDATIVGEYSFIVDKLDGSISSDSLKSATEGLAEKMGDNGVVLLASENDGKVSFVAIVGKHVQKKGVYAGKLVGSVAKKCGGGGGGRPNFAQAGGRDASKLGEALNEARNFLLDILGAE